MSNIIYEKEKINSMVSLLVENGYINDDYFKDLKIVNSEHSNLPVMMSSKEISQYSLNSGYGGTESLILINDHLMTIISKIKSSNYSYARLTPQYFNFSSNFLQNEEPEMETEIILECPIFYNTDEEFNIIKNLKDGKITQILFNEFGQYMYREINNVSYKNESFDHEENQNVLTQRYCLKSISTFDTFKSINEKKFIEMFGSKIKKVGNGKYAKI